MFWLQRGKSTEKMGSICIRHKNERNTLETGQVHYSCVCLWPLVGCEENIVSVLFWLQTYAWQGPIQSRDTLPKEQLINVKRPTLEESQVKKYTHGKRPAMTRLPKIGNGNKVRKPCSGVLQTLVSAVTSLLKDTDDLIWIAPWEAPSLSHTCDCVASI